MRGGWGVRVYSVAALFFISYFGFRVSFSVGPDVGAERQYLRLESLTADSPQTMAIRNVMAMNQKVMSMLFCGLVGVLLFVCKRQLNHTPLYIGLGLMELVPPRGMGTCKLPLWSCLMLWRMTSS